MPEVRKLSEKCNHWYINLRHNIPPTDQPLVNLTTVNNKTILVSYTCYVDSCVNIYFKNPQQPKHKLLPTAKITAYPLPKVKTNRAKDCLIN